MSCIHTFCVTVSLFWWSPDIPLQVQVKYMNIYTLETLLTDTPECLLKSQIKLPNISVHYKPLNSGYSLFHKPDKAESPHTTNTV